MWATSVHCVDLMVEGERGDRAEKGDTVMRQWLGRRVT